ncbi:glycosyltransferase [Sporolactobacillus sp. Y61]|uniref:Glycosyltransferase n=1 Tax=Sporolactobacillus sp. Y61 TaxID=3160863 RepID=A0AAU8IHU3_9BACL
METIPKLIHYFWLGNKNKNALTKKCINSWKKFAPNYRIIEWNEKNIPFERIKAQYVSEAISKQKWAFATDYLRLFILNEYGGLYMDTDVELIRPISELERLESFICFESENTLCTALIGAKDHKAWIKELLDNYNRRKFIVNGRIDMTPNSKYILKFLNQYHGLKLNTSYKQNLKCQLVVFPAEYFSPRNYSTKEINITSNTYAIHHYAGTWKTSFGKIKDNFFALLARITSERFVNIIKNSLKTFLR